MMSTGKLAGRAIMVSGASRGLGKVFTLKAAKEEAVVATRTIFTTPRKVEEAGKEEKQLKNPMQMTVVSKTCLPHQIWFSKDPVAVLGTEDSKSNSVDFSHKASSESFKISPLLWRNEKMTVVQKRLMSSQAAGTIDGIFTAIKGKLSADMVSATQAVFQFNLLEGDKEETYHIDLRNGEGSAGKGKVDNPDATLTMNTENFNKMFTGKLKPTSAFMTGKLKIAGNMQQALKLEKLLSSLKPKA